MINKVISFGGGVQSTAMLVLAAEGRIDYRTFLFSNLGEDTEYPETTAYVENVVKPYAARHGLEFHELRKLDRHGNPMTLYSYLLRDGYRSFPIPVRLTDPDVMGMPGKRACTQDWKTEIVAKWLKQQGATPEAKALVGIGFSVDEMRRVKPSRKDFLENTFPLIEQNLTRQDCISLIRRAKLPVPPKSSCFFCPFHSDWAWQRLRDKHPDLFAQAVDLERHINAVRVEDGHLPAYFTKYLIPLDQAHDGRHLEQGALFQEEEEDVWSCSPFACDEGASPDDPTDPFDGLVVRKVA